MPSPEQVNAAIEDMPEHVRRSVRAGFRNASALPAEERRKFLTYFAQTMSEGSASVDIEALAEDTNIDVRRAAPILTAVSVLVGLLTRGKLSVEQFVAEGRERLFSQEDEPTVKELATSVFQGAAIWEQTLGHRALATRTLPALDTFEISVDLRLRFKAEEVVDTVSVALVHLDTDANNQELWFQMTRGDVENVIQKLQKTLQQMAAAEKLVAKS
jgi:hypothetical protein